MIQLNNLCKSYPVPGGSKAIVDRVTATLPSDISVALLGPNGAGKSTLLGMIAGTIRPSFGEVVTQSNISCPVGFAGSFHPDLTGAQNARFVARIYGADSDQVVEFVQEFSELGAHLGMPFRTYSAGMKARLSFGVSMAIPFDTYLVDEVTSVGDGAFRQKSIAILEERLQTSGAIVVSHSPPMIRRLCRAAAVLSDGQLTLFDDVDEALDQHEQALGVSMS